MEQTQPSTAQRSRTFEWSDPAIYAPHARARTGLELMREMMAGGLPRPPIMQALDFAGIQADHGRVVVTMTVREFHYNPLGTVHGGVIATLLDTATGCAVQTTLPAGVGYTSIDLNTKFLRPVTVDSGELTCVGTVLTQGRRTALAEARLTDARDRLVAHATSSCLLFPLDTP